MDSPPLPAVASGPGLRLVEVGNITSSFVVPAYQRGYRWGPDEVKALLDDIHEISDEKNYCLQPIVVMPRDDGQYELVDGQQRLTTLYLIYRFLERERFKRDGPPFSIRYPTRPDSEEYLRSIDPARATENIDFYHMNRAYETIVAWFGAHEKHRQQRVADLVYGHLADRVKVIWYEVDAGADATELFKRLNVGRIRLTSAELVKALLLGRSQSNGKPTPRQSEIGTHWDAIERELHDPRFWCFLTDEDPSRFGTRIDLLFDLMIDSPPSRDDFRTFHHFKERLAAGESPCDVWSDVVARRDLLKEWYEDPNLFHWIGYLVYRGAEGTLRALLRDSSGMTKSAFEASLRARITKKLGLTHEALAELAYDDDRRRCENALLLFNVETMRRLEGSFDRYPFHAHKDAGREWSLEHIHAQHSESLTRKEQWQTWLRSHGDALRDLPLPEERNAERRAVLREIETHMEDVTNETFSPLAARVSALFAEGGAADNPHSIDNLALLAKDDNSALNNAVFEVKRRRVLNMDRKGHYIPICTRRVFLKYYTDAGDQQLHLWSHDDRKAYLAAMEGMLADYLGPSAVRPATAGAA